MITQSSLYKSSVIKGLSLFLFFFISNSTSGVWEFKPTSTEVIYALFTDMPSEFNIRLAAKATTIRDYDDALTRNIGSLKFCYFHSKNIIIYAISSPLNFYYLYLIIIIIIILNNFQFHLVLTLWMDTTQSLGVQNS